MPHTRRVYKLLMTVLGSIGSPTSCIYKSMSFSRRVLNTIPRRLMSYPQRVGYLSIPAKTYIPRPKRFTSERKQRPRNIPVFWSLESTTKTFKCLSPSSSKTRRLPLPMSIRYCMESPKSVEEHRTPNLGHSASISIEVAGHRLHALLLESIPILEGRKLIPE